MRAPMVSVIIVNWNGLAWLGECLKSLKTQTFSDFEVILVDNGSSDGSVELVEEDFPDFATIIRNSSNLGFAEGNNLGILASKGKYVVTLNNDTRTDPRWLEELVAAAEKDERVGMCASKICFAGEPRTIDSVGVCIYPDGTSKQRAWMERDEGQYETEEDVLLPSACAALYRKEMLEDVGLFDEDFFAYCEDTDLGLRARLKGWTCLLVPGARVFHHYSGTGGSHSLLKAYLVERNRIWVAVKNFPVLLLLTLPIFTLIRLSAQAYGVFAHSGMAFEFVRKHSWLRTLAVLAEAYASAGKKLMTFLRKRTQIQSSRKVSDKEVYNWFRRYALGLATLALRGQA